MKEIDFGVNENKFISRFLETTNFKIETMSRGIVLTLLAFPSRKKVFASHLVH